MDNNKKPSEPVVDDGYSIKTPEGLLDGAPVTVLSVEGKE